MESGSSKISNPEKPPLPQTDVKKIDAGQTDPQPAMATIEDDDERLLARIGYRQVRTYTSPSDNFS
jgi:hypothetical protein